MQPSFPREKNESSKASLLNKTIHHLSYFICVLIIFFSLTTINQIFAPWFLWIVFVTTGFFFLNKKLKSRSQLFLYSLLLIQPAILLNERTSKFFGNNLYVWKEQFWLATRFQCYFEFLPMIFRRLNLTFCSKWVKTFKNWIILQRTRVSHFSIIFFIVNSTVILAPNERRSAFIGNNI